MPELPEVETIRRDLNKRILHREITHITIRKPKIIKNDPQLFTESLLRHSFKNITRRGKLLIFHLTRPHRYLLIHLKMTGQLIYSQKKIITAGGHSQDNQPLLVPNKHTHITFTFSDHSKLFFNDLRQFGYLKIVNNQELALIKKNFGIEPLATNFNLDTINKIFHGKSTSLKSLLLNQKNISGLGNIYVDEISFEAHIRPTRTVNTITAREKTNILKSIKKIIRLAITHRGTTFNNYRDSHGRSGNFLSLLKVYGRANLVCLRCGKSKIKKIKFSGRGTHFCPNCQR